MNYHYTNAPGTLRNSVYAAAVGSVGTAAYGLVQSAGRSDILLCVAS